MPKNTSELTRAPMSVSVPNVFAQPSKAGDVNVRTAINAIDARKAVSQSLAHRQPEPIRQERDYAATYLNVTVIWLKDRI